MRVELPPPIKCIAFHFYSFFLNKLLPATYVDIYAGVKGEEHDTKNAAEHVKWVSRSELKM